MLQPPKAFDTTTAIGMAIFGHIAQDPLTGAYITKSHGRRKAGRPRYYYIEIPTCNMRLMSNGKAHHEIHCIRFTAYGDDEAIELANAKLAKVKHGGGER